MRPTKYDQDQANQTLHSGVRAQNEGKIGIFGFETFLNKVYITLNMSKTMNNEDLLHGSSSSRPLTLLHISIKFELQVTLMSPEWL